MTDKEYIKLLTEYSEDEIICYEKHGTNIFNEDSKDTDFIVVVKEIKANVKKIKKTANNKNIDFFFRTPEEIKEIFEEKAYALDALYNTTLIPHFDEIGIALDKERILDNMKNYFSNITYFRVIDDKKYATMVIYRSYYLIVMRHILEFNNMDYSNEEKQQMMNITTENFDIEYLKELYTYYGVDFIEDYEIVIPEKREERIE